MPIIACIKNDCSEEMVNHCSERNCKLKLTGMSNYVVLEGERICSDHKICDCVIFTVENNQIIIGIIELKSKTAHSSEIEKKLINGSKVALDMLEKCNDKRLKFNFYHIVLSKTWSSSERRIIVSKRIRIGGKEYDIIPKKCGLSFLELLSRLK